MRIHFCGVRGSTPAPGSAFTRVGGHTSCVAVIPEGRSAPTLILDAGTGIRSVTRLLDGAPFRGTILLTHLHWDHFTGLPFFTAGDRADARVQLVVPEHPDHSPAIETLRRAMSPPHFPIGPDQLEGSWSFESMTEGPHEIEGLSITAREVPHKGGRTFGYRISDGRTTFAYLPDHHPAESGPLRAAALTLCRNVDLLIHDAQFSTTESASAHRYGHATTDQAMALATEAGARELALFHHSPDRTDDELDQIARELAAPIPTTLAREGVERSVGPGVSRG